jgi:hypothetical protein
MKPASLARVAAPLLVAATLGCQEARPIAPTAASLFVTNIEGVWSGPLTRVQTSGGECVGEVVETFLPVNDVGTVSMTQTGTAVFATLTMESTGLACRYAGSATGTSLALNATSCDRTGLIVVCLSGQRRELQLVGSSIIATRAGTSVGGNVASTYNVFDVSSGEGVGSLVASHAFTVIRR